MNITHHPATFSPPFRYPTELLADKVRHAAARLLATQQAYRGACLGGREEALPGLHLEFVCAQAHHYDALRAFFEAATARTARAA